MVEEIIGRLPELTGARLGRLEDEIRRERQRRASSDGGRDASRVQEGTAPPLTEVLEYRPHEDGYLQLGATPLHPARRLIARAWTILVLSVPRGREAQEALPRQDQRSRGYLSRQAVKALGGVGRSLAWLCTKGREASARDVWDLRRMMDAILAQNRH